MSGNWAELLEEIGVDVNFLTPTELFLMAGSLLHDRQLFDLRVRMAEERNASADVDPLQRSVLPDVMEALHRIEPHERLALRDRLLGVREIR